MMSISSDSSKKPSLAFRCPPQRSHVSSSTLSRWTCSTTSSAGCSRRPWPVCFLSPPFFGLAAPRFSDESPKSSLLRRASWSYSSWICISSFSCSGFPCLSSKTSRLRRLIIFAISRFSASSTFAARRKSSMSSTSSMVMTRKLPGRDTNSRLGHFFRKFSHSQVRLPQKRRRKLHATERFRAFDEKRQLIHRQLQPFAHRPPPRCGEFSRLKPLRKQAQPRAIKVEHLRSLSVLCHKNVEITRRQIALHFALDKALQRIERLSH